jgi:hypothetical protein
MLKPISTKKENNVGYYADITLSISHDRKVYIQKLFVKKFSIPTKKEALKLIQLQRSFQRKAKKIHVNIVPSKLTYIYDEVNNKHMYVEIQPCVGLNLHQAFRKAKTLDQLSNLLSHYLMQFQKVWQSNFSVTIDPVVDNFGIDSNGVVCYFDFFPPRQTLEDAHRFEWPEPPEETSSFIYARHFSVMQAQVIYGQLLRVLSLQKKISLTQIKTMIGEYLGIKAYEVIDLTPTEQLKILKNPQPFDSYAIRMIAGEYAYKGQLSQQDLKKIFKLTHIPECNTCPTLDKLSAACNYLLAESEYI